MTAARAYDRGMTRDFGSLARLVGTWAFRMRHVALPDVVTGVQAYEFVLDGAFLQQRWRYDHPEFPDAVSLISPTRMHYFDVRGIARVFDLTSDETGWSIVRLDADFGQRMTFRFQGEDGITGTGEMSHDDGTTWVHDFTIEGARTG